MIAQGIAQAEAKLGPDGLPGPTFEISVSLDPRLAGQLRGTLFVFAKAVNGPPMPLAVARFDNPTLPLTVTLDDSMAMAPGMNLSSAKQVQLIARVTASGQVRGEPGDLEGSSAPLDVAAKKQVLALVIDRQL
jgi:cytochrome c-type biogenesis protein CcmH